MEQMKILDNPKLKVCNEPPYDVLQAFVRENHIAKKGSNIGTLKGLVFGAKDVFKIKGSTMGNGHPEWLRSHKPDEITANIITKLLDSGADLVGKTVPDELCYSISGENWNYGSPLNPNDIRRYAGGSSSGSAAATAGGLVDFALGSDCLGSVRVPASYNGIIGMRPTFNRLSRVGEVEYCQSFDMPGFMAKSPDVFKNVAKVLFDKDDNPKDIQGLIIATDCFNCVDSSVSEALLPAVSYLKNNVLDVKEEIVCKEGLDKWTKIFQIIQGYEVWNSYGEWVTKYQPHLNRGPKDRLLWASTVSLNDYNKACEKRKEIISRIDDLIKDGYVICLPTASSVAPFRTASLEDINVTRKITTNLTCISPLSKTPQISLPIAYKNNVPLGIGLIGKCETDCALVDFGCKIVAEYRNCKGE